MGKVIIEQFNPNSKCWNKLYEVDADNFDPNEPYKMDKYGGPYRIQHSEDPKKILDKPIYNVVDMEEEKGMGEIEEDKPISFSNLSLSKEDIEKEEIY